MTTVYWFFFEGVPLLDPTDNQDDNEGPVAFDGLIETNVIPSLHKEYEIFSEGCSIDRLVIIIELKITVVLRFWYCIWPDYIRPTVRHILNYFRHGVLFGDKDINATLDSIIYAGEVTTENYFQILVDVSWWLMKLHGEDNMGWSIFHGALDPTKIGVVRQNGIIRAYIMNYKFAQGQGSL